MSNLERVQVLDCTIRDGGYINDWDFSIPMVRDIYRNLSRAGVQIIEVGFRNSTPSALNSPWLTTSESALQQIRTIDNGAEISVLVDFKSGDTKQFTPASESLVDIVRVAANIDQVNGALDMVAELASLGYKTSLQLMGFTSYTPEDRAALYRLLDEYRPEVVYVADSYGSMFPETVRELLTPLIEMDIFQVGFHPHNNLQLAFANALAAIESGATFIDSTLYGMGRGAGNLATETLLSYLQQRVDDKYNVTPALYCVDMYMVPLRNKFTWGYQLPYMLSGICQCHPTYAKKLTETRKYSIGNVWRALRNIRQHNPIGFDADLLHKVTGSGAFEHGNDETLCLDNNCAPVTDSTPSPAYVNRHEGRSFLVLANGPNLKKYELEIKDFIAKHDPIVMSANRQTIIPSHYHAFINERRFVKHINTVPPESKLLLSPYFKKDLIEEHTSRPYETLGFLTGNRNAFSITNGVISSDCSSVSMLLLAVALVMGAKDIYVAGMDGYVNAEGKGSLYFYTEEDAVSSHEFNIQRQHWGERALSLINNYMTQRDHPGITIITPTSYETYYRGISTLL